MMEWGLPKDEFVENGNVTPQMYIRVARRMIGRYVLTEEDVRRTRHKEDGIAIGSYPIDSHQVDEIMTKRGLRSEGWLMGGSEPYEIPYRSITPPNVRNLLVVCGVSATHIAYGSLRMEPVFMMLGQAGGLAAHLAQEGNGIVQDVEVDELRRLLRADGAILDAPFRPAVAIRVDVEDPAVGQPVSLSVDEIDVRSPIREVWWSIDGSGEVHGREKSFVHRFDLPKEYTVRLVARDGDGRLTNFAEKTVRVGEGEQTDRMLELYGRFLDRMEFDDMEYEGRWFRRLGRAEYDYRQYYQDGDEDKGEKSIRFEPRLEKPGRYLVSASYRSAGNRAREVPFLLGDASGERTVFVDQRGKASPFVFQPVGTVVYRPGSPVSVEISNGGTDGQVIADAIRMTWLGGKDE
jgi:hypothetical protein